jgi:hypothetical protein
MLKTCMHMFMEKLVEVKRLHLFVKVKNPSVIGDVEMAMWETHMCHEIDSLVANAAILKSAPAHASALGRSRYGVHPSALAYHSPAPI